MSRAGVSLPGWDLATFVKRNKNQLCDYMTTGPARLAEIPCIAVPGSRLTGLRFFHVIAFAGPALLISPSSYQNQARFM